MLYVNKEMTNPISSVSASRKLISIIIPCLFGWGLAFLATNVFRDYAFGLFIWLPAVIGALSTMMYGFKNDVNRRVLRNVSYATLGIFSLGLLTFALEGIICILMAAPVGLLFTYIGHWIGYLIIKSKMNGSAPTVMIVLSLSVPALMAFEHSVKIEDDLRLVTTSVEINASIETVWRNVIHFSPLEKPKEFIFKAGISYPISAQIDGQGVGALRHCNFSTGSFSEPITVWNEPNLLKFNVNNQPEPLKELSLYDIHPNHLHGYWVSQKGQFKLTSLSNGHTLLEGTTWYLNKIKPDIYWTIWSDYIVHKIHERVLQHIKYQVEQSHMDSMDSTSNSDQNLLNDIAEYGWHVVKVPEDEVGSNRSAISKFVT